MEEPQLEKGRPSPGGIVRAGDAAAAPQLLQAQGDFAVFIAVDVQHVFRTAGKLSGNGGELIIGRAVRGHLHPQAMLSGRYLHGMDFMPLNVVEHAQTLLVRSFQRVRVGQAAIHPD